MPTPPPPADFDTPWKLALEQYPEAFCGLLFPHVHAEVDWPRGVQFLDKELQQVAPEAGSGRGTVDKLLKVYDRAGAEEWVLVHVEVQSQPEAEFAARMYRYHYRIWDRHGKDVASLAVLGDDRPGWRPTGYDRHRWGCGVRFTFPAVKLLDYADRADALAADPNPLAPFVSAHLRTLETRGDAVARQGWKVRLVKGLYDRGLTRPEVRRLFKLIDWVMTLPPGLEQLFFREIEMFEAEKQAPLICPFEIAEREIAREEGLEVGRQEGVQRGRAAGLRLAVETALDLRFGPAGLALMDRVQGITDPAALESLLRVARTAPDLAAVESHLG